MMRMLKTFIQMELKQKLKLFVKVDILLQKQMELIQVERQ